MTSTGTDLGPDSRTEPDRTVTGTGTPAARWRAAPQWKALPAVPVQRLVPVGHRLVVLAPHPDDETLAAGGLLRMAARAGRDQLVVAVTDGGASHPGSRQWPRELLLPQRRAESATAMQELGLQPEVLHRLGLPDGAVADHADRLRDELTELIGPCDVLVAPWDWDGHPDHEACGRVALAVAQAQGALLLQAPIWGWHWADPSGPWFPWSRAAALDLDDDAAERKRRAAAAYVSQVTADPSTGAAPILPGWALDRLVHDREVFLR